MTEDRHINIRKAAAAIIRDRQLLVCREYDEAIFIAPGGRLDRGESPEQAVIRELQEELELTVRQQQLTVLGVFYAEAATEPGSWLEMTVYLVGDVPVELHPAAEIEELAWINSEIPVGMAVGSIFQHDVLPLLKARNLID